MWYLPVYTLKTSFNTEELCLSYKWLCRWFLCKYWLASGSRFSPEMISRDLRRWSNDSCFTAHETRQWCRRSSDRTSTGASAAPPMTSSTVVAHTSPVTHASATGTRYPANGVITAGCFWRACSSEERLSASATTFDHLHSILHSLMETCMIRVSTV